MFYSFVTLARKQFFDPANDDKKEQYLNLITTLPKQVSKRIQQKHPYIFQDLKEWVKQTSIVHIETMKMSFDISVRNDSTIEDVKSLIQNNEGIPPRQQTLRAKWNGSLWSLGSKKCSNNLEDDRYVKEVMNTYNTDRLALYLFLRPRE